MSQSSVQSFTHLKNQPNGDRALHILQRIASLVKPIMRKHGWTLPVLAEFFPENPTLLGLNVNGGQKICLRLRLPDAPATFYDEEDIVQTMLHELTHNVHGPHDEKFYKFLSELQDEYDTLQRSGYAGEGFFTKGTRVGVGISHDLPPHQARLKALEAAEKRRQISRVLGGPAGNRLGGRINTRGLNPRELAAQAAERRARDNQACASGAAADLEAEKAAKDSVEDKVIDLTMDDSDSDGIVVHDNLPPAGPSGKAVSKPTQKAPPKEKGKESSGSSSRQRPDTLASKQQNIQNDRDKSPSNASSEWSCPACTLINKAQNLQCDACLGERPYDPNLGWTCSMCGAGPMPHEHWSCRVCGTIKLSS